MPTYNTADIKIIMVSTSGKMCQLGQGTKAKTAKRCAICRKWTHTVHSLYTPESEGRCRIDWIGPHLCSDSCRAAWRLGCRNENGKAV